MKNIYQKFLKRGLDLFFSILLIILFSPIFLLLYILIRWQLGSPVFFKQHRPGLQGKPFLLYKFRTMNNETDERDNLLPDSTRLTRFGKFLRNSSLDELPELWNVLKGEMSLVGPRPLLMDYLPLYSPEQMKRHHVRPGITGWAQVNGRNAISWETKFQHDVWYVENVSIVLDVKIIFKTLLKVFIRDGINQEGQATVEKFKGTKSV